MSAPVCLKIEFQRFWRQTKVPLLLFSFASNPSHMADLTVSNWDRHNFLHRFSPTCSKSKLLNRFPPNSSPKNPTVYHMILIRYFWGSRICPKYNFLIPRPIFTKFATNPTHSTETLPFANCFWKFIWFRFRYVQSTTSLFSDSLKYADYVAKFNDFEIPGHQTSLRPKDLAPKRLVPGQVLL